MSRTGKPSSYPALGTSQTIRSRHAMVRNTFSRSGDGRATLALLFPHEFGLACLDGSGAALLPGAQLRPGTPYLPLRLVKRAGLFLDHLAMDARGRLSHVCYLGWPGHLLLDLCSCGNL